MNNSIHIYRSTKFHLLGSIMCMPFVIFWFLGEFSYIDISDRFNTFFRYANILFILPFLSFLIFQSIRRDPVLSIYDDYIELRTLTTGLFLCKLQKAAILGIDTDFEGAADNWCNIVFTLNLNILGDDQLNSAKKVGRLKGNVLFFQYMGAEEKPQKTIDRIKSTWER